MLWPSSSTAFSKQYDSEIDTAVARCWQDFPYPYAWKAQLYQESHLKPEAVSPVGARGIAQFMPATWAQESKALGWANVSPHSAPHAIFAGACYMAKLRRAWRAERPVWDRQWLAQASYNGGVGNLIRAQRICGGLNRYDQIIACLPKVTGRHSKETIDYIERIARIWAQMAPGVDAYRHSITSP